MQSVIMACVLGQPVHVKRGNSVCTQPCLSGNGAGQKGLTHMDTLEMNFAHFWCQWSNGSMWRFVMCVSGLAGFFSQGTEWWTSVLASGLFSELVVGWSWENRGTSWFLHLAISDWVSDHTTGCACTDEIFRARKTCNQMRHKDLALQVRC